ncbi:MAG: S-layer protein [Candidatus Peribacteria bacterium]|nr:S-layer protein [Candidatus Peribacteria bacterium]
MAGALVFIVPLATSAAMPSLPGSEQTRPGFTDVPGDAWYASYIEAAANIGIVAGYTDSKGHATGRFGPGDKVTIAQALKIAINGSGKSIKQGSGNYWSLPFLNYAHTNNFAVVNVSGRLDENRPATRAQVASIVADAFKADEKNALTNIYSDVTAKTEFIAAIEALSRDAVVSGDTNASGQATGHFRPGDSIVRAEVVKMMMKAREKYMGIATPAAASSSSQSVISSSSNSSADASSRAATGATVAYTDKGFSPGTIEVTAGSSVTFQNNSTKALLVASDPHPVHTDDLELNAQNSIKAGESVLLTLTKKGTFGFHNHFIPADRGTITIK